MRAITKDDKEIGHLHNGENAKDFGDSVARLAIQVLRSNTTHKDELLANDYRANDFDRKRFSVRVNTLFTSTY